MSEEYENQSVEQIDSEIANLEGKIAARGVDPQKSPKPADEKPGLFEHGSDAKLTKDLGKIYDKAEGKTEAILGAKDVPTKVDGLDQGFEATYDWLHKPESERAVLRDAKGMVAEIKANAAKFGVELTDEQAMTKAWEMDHLQAQQDQANAANEWQPAAAEISKFYPNAKPSEIAAEYAKLEGRFRSDPVAGFSEMANGIGVHPVRLAQEVIARYQHPQYQQQQQQHRQQQYQQGVAALTNLVEQHYQQFPRMAELEEDVLAELNSTKRSGDPAKDLQAAYRRADAKNRKRSTSDRIDRSMNATFDRVNKR